MPFMILLLLALAGAGLALGPSASADAALAHAALSHTALAPAQEVSAADPDPGAALAAFLASPAGAAEVARLRAREGWAVSLLSDLALIVSPSGEEHARAARVAEAMREIGLVDVEVDASPNAIGRIPGRSGQALVFISTLDDLATVAQHRREAEGPPTLVTDAPDGARLVGPGTNTSSITVSMLLAAEALVRLHAEGEGPEHDLIFAAVAQEETGLLGMQAIHDRFGDRAVGFVDILGDGRSVSYGALGIHWWRVVGEGPPGHSLGGGLPNVNQGLARAVDRILTEVGALQDPERRTVVNVAMLRSGDVFNHKPSEGWFSLDLRSLDADRIEAMEGQVRRILDEVGRETGTALRMEPFQIMPGGQVEGMREHPLVQASLAIGRHLGFEPSLSNAGSSNMNVAIARGTPATGLGGSRGGDRGFATEWASVPAMMRAGEHVLLLGGVLGGGLP